MRNSRGSFEDQARTDLGHLEDQWRIRRGTSVTTKVTDCGSSEGQSTSNMPKTGGQTSGSPCVIGMKAACVRYEIWQQVGLQDGTSRTDLADNCSHVDFVNSFRLYPRFSGRDTRALQNVIYGHLQMLYGHVPW